MAAQHSVSYCHPLVQITAYPEEAQHERLRQLGRVLHRPVSKLVVEAIDLALAVYGSSAMPIFPSGTR